MAVQQITASDITGWDSLQDIADSFEKRGLKHRPNLGENNELVLQIDDDEFVVLVEAGPGQSATDFKPDNRTRHTNLVATNNFENFTFLSRMRSWGGQKHGRIKYQKISFTKDQFARDSGEKNTVLKKLNLIEYGSSTAIYDTLYDTQQVVEEFYQDFEDLRIDLIQKVSGIPDDRGDAKQRYVQVILDRMIFLYFIQEKRLLHRNTNYLHEQPAKVVGEGDDRYKEFYEPLFFEYLAKDKQDPDFGKLPYLNGGLFARNPVEEEFENVKLGDSAEQTNDLFAEILDFLSDWNWNVDERLDIVDPKNLSPAILGHIFEQTVNQKEMGAYYTPEEITGFMARRTVHPYLLDQLNEAVGVTYEEIDDVFGFSEMDANVDTAAIADGGVVTQQAPTENVDVGHVETLYHDILTEAKLLDPAVGSGAFLLAGQEVLLDLYVQCIEFFQQLEDEGKGWELSSQTRDELETIASGKGSASLYAKRTIILNNLYGVDIDEGAVEICKLRLWLSMVADIEDEPGEVEPLPNIDFNIRQGNSLIGLTDTIEPAADKPTSPENSEPTTLGDWDLRSKYQDIIEAIRRHRNAETSQAATHAREEAEHLIEEYRGDFDERLFEEFSEAGLDEFTPEDLRELHPLHWALEFPFVWETGKFDIVIGNPPWEVVTSDRDEYFSKFDEIFRTRSTSEKDEVQEKLLKDDDIRQGWEEHKIQSELLTDFFTKSSIYSLQSPDVGGQGKNDLSVLFVERVLSLVSDEGYFSQIVPGKVLHGTTAADLRRYLLSETAIDSIMAFENKKQIFSDIHGQYKFGIVTARNNSSTSAIHGIFQQHDVSILQNNESAGFTIPREVLEQYSPTTAIFPQLKSQSEVGLLKSIIQHPQIGDSTTDGWCVDVYKEELNRSRDKDRFVESEDEGDYPVYGGGNIHQFEYNSTFDDLDPIEFWSVDEDRDQELSAKRRIREKNLRRLKRALYDAFDGSGSQIGFVNELLEDTRGKPLSEADVLLDCTEYRLGFREISNATNERSFITAVIPTEIVCHHKLPTIRPYTINPSRESLVESNLHGTYRRIFTDEELFTVEGLLNSIAFDYLIRTKLDTSLGMYMIEESQAPRLTEGDNWFHFISERAARLNCYGKEFEEMRKRLNGIEPVTEEEERRKIQAEIDAAVFHAYGLDRREVEFLLNDFHKVSNPRLMDKEYFSMVLEKYDLLEQDGPLP
jgi:hypothetical protein